MASSTQIYVYQKKITAKVSYCIEGIWELSWQYCVVPPSTKLGFLGYSEVSSESA